MEEEYERKSGEFYICNINQNSLLHEINDGTVEPAEVFVCLRTDSPNRDPFQKKM